MQTGLRKEIQHDGGRGCRRGGRRGEERRGRRGERAAIRYDSSDQADVPQHAQDRLLQGRLQACEVPRTDCRRAHDCNELQCVQGRL